MTKDEIKTYFEKFIKDYDENSKNEIWKNHNQKFIAFWNNRIFNKKSSELSDQEIDEVIKILDKHGRGNREADEAVAKVMIPQGAWNRMFNEIKNDDKLSKLIYEIFKEQNQDTKAKLIDTLYKKNEGKKNYLTGQSGNAINSFLAAYAPFENVSIVSVNDRIKLMEFLKNPQLENYKTFSTGKKMSQSNFDIIQAFRELGIMNNARTISAFCYSPYLKSEWKKEGEAGYLIAEEEDELAFPEGKEIFRLHISKERNKELIRAAKQKRLQTDTNLSCEVCGFSFVDKYGELGKGFIEAHHLFPISKLKEETKTKIEDLALVCSNCHRMLHRKRPWLELEELKTISL